MQRGQVLVGHSDGGCSCYGTSRPWVIGSISSLHFQMLWRAQGQSFNFSSTSKILNNWTYTHASSTSCPCGLFLDSWLHKLAYEGAQSEEVDVTDPSLSHCSDTKGHDSRTISRGRQISQELLRGPVGVSWDRQTLDLGTASSRFVKGKSLIPTSRNLEAAPKHTYRIARAIAFSLLTNLKMKKVPNTSAYPFHNQLSLFVVWTFTLFWSLRTHATC